MPSASVALAAKKISLEIDDDIDSLNVYASSDEICSHENSGSFFLRKVLKDLVSFILVHLGVDVKTRMLEFNNFFRQQLYTQG